MPCCVPHQRECGPLKLLPAHDLTSAPRSDRKPAHSDLLQAIPQGNPQTLEEKIALVTPFVYVRAGRWQRY